MKPNELLLIVAQKLAASHGCTLIEEINLKPKYFSLRCNALEEKNGKLKEVIEWMLVNPFGFDYAKLLDTVNKRSSAFYTETKEDKKELRAKIIEANKYKLNNFVWFLYNIHSKEGRTYNYWSNLWPEDGGGGRFEHWLEDLCDDYYMDLKIADAENYWNEFILFLDMPREFFFLKD